MEAAQAETKKARKAKKRDTVSRPAVQKFLLADLEFAKYNPRSLEDASFQGLRDSLQQLGMLEMPVVNTFNGAKRVVSGHQRIRAMIEEGYTHADCAVVSFDDAKERMANLSMNNPAIQGDWDAMKALPTLKDMAAALPSPDALCLETLRTDLAKQVEQINKQVERRRAEDEVPEEAPGTVSRPDRIYALGRHRLYSGDCLQGLPRLLNGAKAKCCVTDPPYNVSFANFRDSVNFPGRKPTIANDSMEPEKWLAFVDAFCKLILEHTDGPCYVFGAYKELPTLTERWIVNGGILHRWLVWAKDSFGFGLGDYRYQYEICLYGFRSGLLPNPPKTPRTNVIEVPRPHLNELHPTQKPVEIIKAFVEDGSEPDDVVIDPFLGSGTAIAVCEELGRTCLGAEVDLAHCDTIRKRWAEQVHGAGADWESLTKPVTTSKRLTKDGSVA